MFGTSNMTWNPKGEKCLTATLVEFSDESARELKKTGKLNCDQQPNEDVLGVAIYSKASLIRIPNNLPDFFPNITALSIWDCEIKKICRSDLKNYVRLKEIYIMKSTIEELPADLFTDIKDLEIVRLPTNRIKFIGKDIFKHQKKLKYVDLTTNPSIDLFYTDGSYKEFEIPEKSSRVNKLDDLNAKLDEIFQLKCVSEKLLDIENVLKLDDFKDFLIKIDGIEFKAHKLLLAARSRTLAEMIKNNPDADELILTEIDVDVFNTILEYIYDDKIPENYDENSSKVFTAAGKLKIGSLMSKVGDILSNAVNPENSFDMLKLASQYNHDELKKKSFDEVKKLFPGKNLKDELMNDLDALDKLIDAKKAYDEKLREAEEAKKRADDDFEKLFL